MLNLFLSNVVGAEWCFFSFFECDQILADCLECVDHALGLVWGVELEPANAVRQRLPRGNEAVGQGDALPGHASLRGTERPPKYSLEAKTCIRGVKFARNKGSLPFAAPSCMCFFDASDVLQRGTDMGFLGSQCGHWGVVAQEHPQGTTGTSLRSTGAVRARLCQHSAAEPDVRDASLAAQCLRCNACRGAVALGPVDG